MSKKYKKNLLNKKTNIVNNIEINNKLILKNNKKSKKVDLTKKNINLGIELRLRMILSFLIVLVHNYIRRVNTKIGRFLPFYVPCFSYSILFFIFYSCFKKY